MNWICQIMVVLILFVYSSNGFTQDISKCKVFLKIDKVIFDHPLALDIVKNLKLDSIQLVLRINDKQVYQWHSFLIMYQKKPSAPDLYYGTVKQNDKILETALKYHLRHIEDGDIIYIDDIFVSSVHSIVKMKIHSFILEVENGFVSILRCD